MPRSRSRGAESPSPGGGADARSGADVATARRRPPARAGAAGVLAVAASLFAAAGPAALPLASSAVAAEPTPLDIFQKFIRDDDPSVRRKAVASLADQRGAGVVEALLGASQDEDAGVRDRAEGILLDKRDRSDEVAALGAVLAAKRNESSKSAAARDTALRGLAVRALERAGMAASPHLRLALREKSPEVRTAAARALAAIRDRGASPELHVLLTHAEPTVRAEACASIGALLEAESVGTAAGVALGDERPEPRMAACAILGRHPAPEGCDALLRCLVEESWSLRVAAARGLAEVGRDPEMARKAAAALVLAMGREPRTRVQVEFAESLWALTAIDFGPDAERWTRWGKETGGKFEPPAKRPVRPKRSAGSTQGGLADLPLESEHVSFVFDASGSMADAVRFGSKVTKREDLQAAFGSVVPRLPKGAWINLIPFSTAPMPMKPALFEATPSARQAVIRHLEKTPPEGRTNIYDAIETALSDPDADTIVLLTDGAPSAGKRVQRNAIVEGIAELNRWRLARIHTIEIGAANTGARWKGFLEDISDATGGRHLAR